MYKIFYNISDILTYIIYFLAPIIALIIFFASVGRARLILKIASIFATAVYLFIFVFPNTYVSGLNLRLLLFLMLVGIAVIARNLAIKYYNNKKQPLIIIDDDFQMKLSAILLGQIIFMFARPFIGLLIWFVLMALAYRFPAKTRRVNWVVISFLICSAISIAIESMIHPPSLKKYPIIPYIIALSPFILPFLNHRLYPWVMAILMPFVVYLLWLLGRPLGSNGDWGTGLGIIWLIALAISVGGRLLSSSISAKHWAPAIISSCPCIAALIIFEYSPSLAREIGAQSIIYLAIATVIALIIISFIPRNTLRLTALSCAAMITLGTYQALTWPMKVISAAQFLAKDTPYCITVASNKYEAKSQLDLTPIVMRAHENGRTTSTHHAVMLLNDGTEYYFSYVEQKFLNNYRVKYQNIPCTPKQNFAKQLKSVY